MGCDLVFVTLGLGKFLNLLCLCFLLCEMGQSALHMSEACYKDERRWHM